MSGSNLAALRRARGWSQKELASRAGVTQAMVSYFERWDPAPKGLVTAIQIASALDVPVESLWAPTTAADVPTTAPTTSPDSASLSPAQASAK